MARELVRPHWDRLVYAHRLTHIDNIPYLLRVGFVHATSDKANYFGPHSPMLYVIQNGLNGVKKHNATDIVHCVVKIETVIRQGWDCIFTDGHAVAGITEFFPKERLSAVNELVRVEDVYAKYWMDEYDLDLQRRKQAELLVKDDIPAQYIAGFFVYDDVAKEKLSSMGVEDCSICVSPEYYFSNYDFLSRRQYI